MSSVTIHGSPVLPPELVEAASSGHLIVLVGEAASQASGMPSWRSVIDQLQQRALLIASPEQRREIKEAEGWGDSSGELLEKAALLGQTMGEAWLTGALAALFRAPACQPSSLHQALAKLPRAAFMTTNYDTLLEQALEAHSGMRPRVVLVSDVEGLLSFGSGQVLKLHGDVDRPESLVLSTKDYAREDPLLLQAWKKRLEALLQPPYQLLLVGHGYQEAHFQESLQTMRDVYAGRFEGPFWLVKEDARARSTAKTHGLRPLWLANQDESAEWLERFAREAEQRRAQPSAVVKVEAVVYAEIVWKHFKSEQEQAGKLFEEGCYEAALATYEKIVEQVKVLLEKNPRDEQGRRTLARCRVNVGACLINLQRIPEGRSLLRKVAETERDWLKPRELAVLAHSLAQVDELTLARGILPKEDSSPLAAETHQLLDILEGQPSETPPATPVLQVHTLRFWIEKGNVAKAATLALSMLRNTGGDAYFLANALAGATDALRRSVLEDRTASSLAPLEDRVRLVKAIEQGLPTLNACVASLKDASYARSFRVLEQQIKINFHDLVRDEHMQAEIEDFVNEWGSEALVQTREVLAQRKAQELASAGQLEEAMQLLPPDDGSWQVAFRRAMLTGFAGKSARALEEFTALSRQWPGKAPIEFMAATLLLEASRFQEALAHALAAYEALPGYGFRMLLGQCFHACGETLKAADVLAPLASSGGPRALWICASVFEQVEPAHGLELWKKYLALAPDDVNARLLAARLSGQLGRHEEATEAAWKLFQEFAEELSAQELFACAQLLLAGAVPGTTTQERIHQIASTLGNRFPNDSEAEMFRFHLSAALGFPKDLKPVDLERLKQAGTIKAVSVEEAKSLVKERFQVANNAWKLYSLGAIPFEALCSQTGMEAATLVASLLEPSASTLPALCPPVMLSDDIALPSLSGQRILVGELELLLLQQLGLLDSLRKALGEKGRLVLFEEVWERIGESSAQLGHMAQRAELERMQRLLELLARSNKLIVDKGDPADSRDDTWAEKKGLPFIESRRAREALSPRMVVRALRERGLLDRGRADHLENRLQLEAEPLPEALPPLPGRAAIDFGPLIQFFDAGVLETVLQLFPGGLEVGPATWQTLSRRHETLRLSTIAARLSNAVQRAIGTGLAEGWVQKRPRPPDIPGLPVSRQPERTFWREVLAESLGFRQALIEEPDMCLLSADFFTVAPLGTLREIVTELAWPSRESFHQMALRMREVESRVLVLPGLVRRLLGAHAREKLQILARVGFTDALGAEEILALARDYPGLDADVPSQILGRLEEMARIRDHLNTQLVFLRLARVYAQAIWSAFKHSPAQEQIQATALATTLLGRMENLSRQLPGPVLDLFLYSACLVAVENRRDAFTRGSKGYVLSGADETPSARFWEYLKRWAGTGGRRRDALARAFREAWLSLDDLARTDAQRRIAAAALMLPATLSPTTLVAPELEPLAILSATWGERPLAAMHADKEAATIEALLQSFADSLTSGEPPSMNESQIVRRISRENGTESWEVAPIEAVLLRASEEGVRRWATTIAQFQGPHDGRAYLLLMQLATTPGNEVLRREYARMSISVPWRLVREAPAQISTWGWLRSFGERAFPGNLQDLRDMLSEPHGFLDSETPAEFLRKRVLKGEWAERLDGEELLWRASAVPGSMPSLPLFVGLIDAPSFQEHVRDALTRLRQPESFPAAQLAGDIYVLRVAASRSPRVELPEGWVDLRDILPDRLLRVLQSAENPDLTADNIATHEPALLRLCMEVVGRLSNPLPLPMKDGLWLTFRLYQWLWAQLEALSPDARAAALKDLSKVAPPPAEHLPPEADLLHPFRFSRGHFDYRLATLLYAFSAMEVLPHALSASQELPPGEIYFATSTALEELLARLATRPLTDAERTFREQRAKPSVFDWQGAGSIPELALEALLVLSPAAVLQIPEERRLQWLQDVPMHSEHRGRLRWELAMLLMGALVNLLDRVSPAERAAYEDRLRALTPKEDPKVQLLSWWGLTGLYDAGHEGLEAEVRALLLEHLSDSNAPKLFGRYLLALAARTPERLQPVAEEVLSLVEKAGVDPVPFAGGVGLVAAMGKRQTASLARDLLKKLSNLPPYQGQDQMRNLLGTLGLL